MTDKGLKNLLADLYIKVIPEIRHKYREKKIVLRQQYKKDRQALTNAARAEKRVFGKQIKDTLVAMFPTLISRVNVSNTCIDVTVKLSELNEETLLLAKYLFIDTHKDLKGYTPMLISLPDNKYFTNRHTSDNTVCSLTDPRIPFYAATNIEAIHLKHLCKRDLPQEYKERYLRKLNQHESVADCK